MFPGRNGLPDLCFKITHLPVYRSFHFQVFKTFSYQCQTSFHIHYILVQTAYLSQTKQTILTDPLIQYRQLFFYRFIFLRSLEIVLPRYQLPLHQPLVLSVTTFLYNEFFLNTDTILLQTQPFLLHTYTSITQLIFLIGQICFTLHDTDIQQRITQAQILDLLRNLKDRINSSIMFITHDLGVIAEMADYVVVMYAGRIVEQGTAEEIFAHPAHPYTIGLMASKPVVGKQVDKLYSIPGKVPNPINMPNYCYFKDRCEMCVNGCEGAYPHEISLTPTHKVSCYRYYPENMKKEGE